MASFAVLLVAAGGCNGSQPGPPDLAVPQVLPDLRIPTDLFVVPDLTPLPPDFAVDCINAHPCNRGLVCCNGACVDISADFQNCNGCGLACFLGFNCCGGVCSNPTTDVNNCGSCGTACSSICGQPPKCMNRTCLGGPCGNECGWADCNMNPADGCETHIDTDTNNCGACGNVCPMGQRCVAGKCK